MMGTHTWYVGFLAPGGGATTPVPIATLTQPPGTAHAALLTDIRVGPYGVVDRALYRSAGTETPRLVGNLGDNATDVYLDEKGDDGPGCGCSDR